MRVYDWMDFWTIFHAILFVTLVEAQFQLLGNAFKENFQVVASHSFKQ